MVVPGRLCRLLVPLAFQTFWPISGSEMLMSWRSRNTPAPNTPLTAVMRVEVLCHWEFITLFSVLGIISLAAKGKPDAFSVFLCDFFPGTFTKRSTPLVNNRHPCQNKQQKEKCARITNLTFTHQALLLGRDVFPDCLHLSRVSICLFPKYIPASSTDFGIWSSMKASFFLRFWYIMFSLSHALVFTTHLSEDWPTLQLPPVLTSIFLLYFIR